MRRIPWATGALAGIAAACVGLGVGELLAAFVGTSPLSGVSSFVIDLTPGWLKEFVISFAGTADKVVLILSLLVVVAVTAVLAGLLERVRPPWGSALLGLLAVVAVVAVSTRSGATPLAPLPAVVGAAASIVALRLLTRRAVREERVVDAPAAAAGSTRRSFLVTSIAAAVIGAAAAATAQTVSLGSRAIETARRAIRLPQPATAAPPVPPGAILDVPGISPLITPNADFYRIDTAVFLPLLDPAEWTLKITGMVEHPVEIGYDQLLALPMTESRITIGCVSNPVGGPYISTATWLGYPIRNLLAWAKPLPDADMVLSKSSDGFTAGTPIEALTDDRDALLAVGMNGAPLPREHGFPARMVVPGLFGYVSATKWVVELEVTRYDRVQAYWTQRGWGEQGPVKMSSRIDVPIAGRKVSAGTVTVAGVAWEQHTGISKVEVQVDDGPWNEARLGDALSADTWRQWSWDWPAEPGTHTLTVRATDTDGVLQDTTMRNVLPDGATGLHAITVEV
ncbi:molybdopterin-dependent oxidoreductase [Naasia aerilata]|uniref:Oxidoreductase n=1 Tax=Naasia aerilata TaxID=1162966 RepID=A0ABM8GE07_9MICO|nr:molybdopterin-dependent oxidoreductase [Naasia aerilata]BDZ46512.1 oxidoreductase [Naasia aerilata]